MHGPVAGDARPVVEHDAARGHNPKMAVAGTDVHVPGAQQLAVLGLLHRNLRDAGKLFGKLLR